MHNLIVYFTVLLLFINGCSNQDSAKSDFNIVLITVDTLRADHLSCYGYVRKTSPNIDTIAENGIVFKDVIAPSSWTAPSIVSLFTSVYPINHGVVSGAGYGWNPRKQEIFSEKLTTLTEILKSCGYTTFGVASNLHLKRKFGFARGFDYFECLSFSAAFRVNKAVFKWEDKIKSSNKYFLWVHYIDPHFPYSPRTPWIKQYISSTSAHALDIDKKHYSQLRELIPQLINDKQALSNLVARYDSEINYVDVYLGALIKKLDLDNNTLIIITSDHGEEFLEHGDLGHGGYLYQESINIPLIVKLPFNYKKEINEGQVNLIDIMPSILHMLNITPTEQIAGKSFWRRDDLLFWLKKALSGNDPPNYNYAETGGEVGLKTVITPQWKYIYNYKLQTDQLYNIRSDSLELNNLVDAEPKQRDQLKEKLFTWVIRSKKYPPKKETHTLSKEDREKFEALGYAAVKETEGDEDSDGIPDEKDNCPKEPNGPNKGICTGGYIGEVCVSNAECGDDGFCSMNQEDMDRDGIGDVCKSAVFVAH